MVDFEVQKFTRRCAVTDRELQPGESFYSVLVAQGADVVRLDYAESEWQGPSDDAIGFWKSEVPDPGANRMQLAPSEVLLDYFESLQDDLEKRVLAYVLSLLLIRRRLFKLEETQRDENDHEVMLVYCARREKEYRVDVVTPDNSEIDRVQQELAQMLFAGAD